MNSTGYFLQATVPIAGNGAFFENRIRGYEALDDGKMIPLGDQALRPYFDGVLVQIIS